MAGSDRKKILVAVDGSESALESVRYVGAFHPANAVEVTLFHVMTRIPESFWDLEKDHSYHYKIADIHVWERQQEENIMAFAARARQILIDSGLPQEAVTVTIEDRKIGIARDIVAKSHEGYSAVVVGRRGLSQLKDIVMGSIAHKLVEKIAHIPVWIVGGTSHSRRILLPVDPSEGSLRAVDHVGRMVGGAPGYEVVLFHAVRGYDIFQQIVGRSFMPGEEKERGDRAEDELEEASKEMESTFQEARRRLESRGMVGELVKEKVVTGVASRAGAIVDEARMESFDTIVVGRRGLSKVQEFFMGRVGNKVVQLAKDKTVWVVS